MSESIDRVFVKAIGTIRTLSSRTGYGGLPRPPIENRVKLYGLYKQATEGDVAGVMERPLGDSPEAEAAKRKWDAWRSEQGTSKTEAKRHYISYLIDTMKQFASDTTEARELLSELEYLWNQISDVSPNDSSDSESNAGPAQLLQNHAQLLSRDISVVDDPITTSGMDPMYNPSFQRHNSSRFINASTAERLNSLSNYYNTLNPTPPLSSRRYQGSVTPRNVDFIKWQNDINNSINKLNHDLQLLANRRLQSSASDPIYSKRGSDLTHDDFINDISSSSSNRKFRARRTQPLLSKLLLGTISLLLKLTKTVIKHVAIDAVIIAVLVAIIKRSIIIPNLISNEISVRKVHHSELESNSSIKGDSTGGRLTIVLPFINGKDFFQENSLLGKLLRLFHDYVDHVSRIRLIKRN
ncbi:BA75_04723T0 [Komagataella pastoris]|uniref:BA75_04723T0 n=1 Tax=Komagataella pastoris TaxID=4922 RepID=A0A1B2JJ69_PICPA|nr:BA75_04723T0 [Komagataella pastoris]